MNGKDVVCLCPDDIDSPGTKGITCKSKEKKAGHSKTGNCIVS